MFSKSQKSQKSLKRAGAKARWLVLKRAGAKAGWCFKKSSKATKAKKANEALKNHQRPQRPKRPMKAYKGQHSPKLQIALLLSKFLRFEFEKDIPLKICHYSVTSNFKWKIFKILCPSQNIWTLIGLRGKNNNLFMVQPDKQVF